MFCFKNNYWTHGIEGRRCTINFTSEIFLVIMCGRPARAKFTRSQRKYDVFESFKNGHLFYFTPCKIKRNWFISCLNLRFFSFMALRILVVINAQTSISRLLLVFFLLQWYWLKTWSGNKNNISNMLTYLS